MMKQQQRQQQPVQFFNCLLLQRIFILLLLCQSTLSFSLNDKNAKYHVDNHYTVIPPIRLNKVFRETHSRRQADALIANQRVRVNGEIVQDMGRKVVPFQDIIHLDEEPYTGWERQNGFMIDHDDDDSSQQQPLKQVYIKFWKPIGITSTTETSIPGNLLEALERYNRPGRKMIQQRIFSVGRLDKDSSGLLLLTSDGRLPNAVLSKQNKQPKTYRVIIDKPIQKTDLQRLRQGIVITTDTVRPSGGPKRHISLTARTLPCQVRIIHSNSSYSTTTTKSPRCELEMTLVEGRNRQIRVMLQTLGYNVLALHRTHFLGIDLSGLENPGDWIELNPFEEEIIHQAIQKNSHSNTMNQ